MIDLKYCDLYIMSSNRILINTYNIDFLGKYIFRDFNESILKIDIGFSECLMFGYIFDGIRKRSSSGNADFDIWDLRVKKIS